ncbi:hypothetical protein FGG08_001210 [Glutinoglossum americanum]|uniref:Uncharacterized protein n=1 Tax=Glutinoglossum americanum TaxID=1670608 RepID=A0A9P8IBL2_9PEZI|nr:hypothetical protein FGG08_001210 [Glutinoglossum americanum]
MASRKAAGDVVSVYKKYTVQSTGVWDRIRRILSIDPNRSTGVPLNPQFRNPPPGANPPELYDDPTSTPAADLADNPYWKRDTRRAYPRLSVVNQAHAVGLLSVGSKAAPLRELVGEDGTKQLVAVKQEGEERGLAALFEKDKGSVGRVLGEGGLPPLPVNLGGKNGGRLEINREEGYPEDRALTLWHVDLQLFAIMSATELAALEAIFSCGICFVSYSDIYGNDKFVDTLNDPGLSLPGTIPKLWMTSCGHVICGRHLEGGDCGQKEDVALYPIWGVTDGFYDARLPKAFFKVPPVKFDKIHIGGARSPGQWSEPARRDREANEHAREALRFQFISLICYAKGIRTKLFVTERERNELRQRSERELKVSQEENAGLLTSLHRLDDQREKYRDRVAVLEEEKAVWQQKKRMAVHYLGLVGALADENTMLKQKLVSLGYSVEKVNYAFHEDELNFLSSDRGELGAAVGQGGRADSIALKDRDKKCVEPGAVSASQAHDIRSSSDHKKRKFLSSRGEVSSKARSTEDLRAVRRHSSRDDMPPPPLPLGRGHAHTASRVSLFASSQHTSDSLSVDQFSMSIPVITTSQTPVGRDVVMPDQPSETQLNWPFAGPNQIDATRGQTATSAYFSRPRTSHVFRLESMEWVKGDDEPSNALAQHDAAHTGNGHMDRASALGTPTLTLAEARNSTQTKTTSREQPKTHVLSKDRSERHGSAPLTEASLATLREQLRRTGSHSHRQNQLLLSMSNVMPLLDRDYPSLVADGSILTGSAADRAVFQHSVVRQNSLGSSQDRPLLERGSSLNEGSSRMSLPILEQGSSNNFSYKAGSVLSKVASISCSAVNPTPDTPKTAIRHPVNSLSTAPFWLRGLGNPAAQKAVMQTNRNSDPGWYSSQAETRLDNPRAPQGQPLLSIGNARGLVSKSSKWIKRGTKGLRNLAARTPSVTSPFFKREDMGTPRRPSPTMEESESYEVYQRFRADDCPRASRHSTPAGGIISERDSSVLRSAAIREHISGSASPEDILRASLPFHRPFTPTYASPNITIVETSFGGSRMAPSSGRRIVRR